MSKKPKAFGDGVIIKATSVNRELGSGIVLADMGQERPETGIIVSIGKGAYSITGNWMPTELKKGIEVIVPKVGTTSISVDGEVYLITKEREISAIYEENDDTDAPKDF